MDTKSRSTEILLSSGPYLNVMSDTPSSPGCIKSRQMSGESICSKTVTLSLRRPLSDASIKEGDQNNEGKENLDNISESSTLSSPAAEAVTGTKTSDSINLFYKKPIFGFYFFQVTTATSTCPIKGL